MDELLPFDFDEWAENAFPPTTEVKYQPSAEATSNRFADLNDQQVFATLQGFPFGQPNSDPIDLESLLEQHYNKQQETTRCDINVVEESKPVVYDGGVELIERTLYMGNGVCQIGQPECSSYSSEISNCDFKMDGDFVAEELADSKGAKEVKNITWTDDENNALVRFSVGEKQDASWNNRSVSWQAVTKKFNDTYGRDLKREQIYQHYYHVTAPYRTASAAEVEVVHALREIGLSDEAVVQFLDNDYRYDNDITKVMNEINEKLKQREESKLPADSDEDMRRIRFRRKIFNYVSGRLSNIDNEPNDNAGPSADELDNHKKITPNEKWQAIDKDTKDDIIGQVRKWIDGDPKVKRKMHTVAQIGRPQKTMTLSKSISELARLLRPFRKAYRWRQRITYHPGDIRKSALSSFTLHRLLGAPFEVDNLPDVRDEDADETRRVAAVTKSLIKNRTIVYPFDGDKASYFARELPPPESVLPPTLHTVAGIRGLLLHKINLEESARDDCEDLNDENMALPRVKRRELYGNAESDDKLMRCMLSLFYWPMRLCLKIVNNEIQQLDNSDGDSDSDDDKCWPSGIVQWPGL